MKLRPCFFLSLGFFLAPTLPAQEPPPAALGGPAESGPGFSANQLELLLGPIALYPDALIALILPAATAPSDLVLAARYLKGGGDPAHLEDQPWDESVKSLAHYGAVVSWMDENLGWTKQLGEAFLDQPAEVMKAVQRLRAKAKAAGTLVNTPEQEMVIDGDDISIVPTQPDMIYVPRYDPDVVYYVERRDYPNPLLTFGPAYPAGLWLTFDIDWGRRSIWTSRGRDTHRDWRHPAFPGRPGFVPDPNRQPWQPPSRPVPRAPRPVDPNRPPPGVVQPPPLPGAPPRPPGWHREPPDQHNPPGRPDDRGRDPRAPGSNPPTFVPPAPTDRPRNPDRTGDDHGNRTVPLRDFPLNQPSRQAPPAVSAPPAPAPARSAPPAPPAPTPAPPAPRDNPPPSSDDRRDDRKPRTDQPN